MLVRQRSHAHIVQSQIETKILAEGQAPRIFNSLIAVMFLHINCRHRHFSSNVTTRLQAWAADARKNTVSDGVVSNDLHY